MSYAETLILDIVPGKVPQVAAVLSAVSGMGAWVTEIGHLNRITLLRLSDTVQELLESRAGILAALPHEFLLRSDVTSWRVLSPVMPAGAYGSVYEWRCYESKTDGMASTERLFMDALPARLEHSSLLCALVSLEGTPRFAHLWPYADLNDRASARANAVVSGQWPPKIAGFLNNMDNEILLPLANSIWH